MVTGLRAGRGGVEGKSEKEGDLEALDDIESACKPGFGKLRSKAY